MKNSSWERGTAKDNETEEKRRKDYLQTLSYSQTATSKVADNSDAEQAYFVRCSVPANLPRDKTDTMTGTYLPKNALELTPTLRERWGIKADAYFTIYYNNEVSF